jgi:hypothetical protein
MRILDPTEGPFHADTRMAPRLESLKGAKVGVIWNGRPHGRQMLETVIDDLSARWQLEVVAFLQKEFVGNKAPSAFFDEIKARGADFVLAGVGD